MKQVFASTSVALFEGSAATLSAIPDSSIDMGLCDPPYGMDYISGHRIKEKEGFKTGIESDEKFNTILMQQAFTEYHRVLKDKTALYVFCRWDSTHRFMRILEDVGFIVKNRLVWAKDGWTGGDLNGNYANQTEDIVYCTKGDHKLLGRRDSTLLAFKKVPSGRLIHPTEKPVSLCAWLVCKSCPKDGVVLDSFCGSGPVLEAAEQVGRKAIGIDIEPKNLAIAQRRIEKKFLPLFEQVVPEPNFQMEFK